MKNIFTINNTVNIPVYLKFSMKEVDVSRLNFLTNFHAFAQTLYIYILDALINWYIFYYFSAIYIAEFFNLNNLILIWGHVSLKDNRLLKGLLQYNW